MGNPGLGEAEGRKREGEGARNRDEAIIPCHRYELVLFAVTETEHPRFSPRVTKLNGEGQKHNSLLQDGAKPTKPSQETL